MKKKILFALAYAALLAIAAVIVVIAITREPPPPVPTNYDVTVLIENMASSSQAMGAEITVSSVESIKPANSTGSVYIVQVVTTQKYEGFETNSSDSYYLVFDRDSWKIAFLKDLSSELSETR